MARVLDDRMPQGYRLKLTRMFSMVAVLPFLLGLGELVAADGEPRSMWFWPDPFPQLGHESIEGDGWMYLRIASDEQAAREIGLSDPQRKEMWRYFTAAQKQEREQARQRRSAGETAATTWAWQLRKLWQREADAASSLLSVEQDRRIKQLILQRLSYNAFVRDDVAEFVDMNDDQRTRIAAAIHEHLQRLQAKDDQIDDLIKRLGGGLRGEPLQDRVHELKTLVDARGSFGRRSHQQVWTEIHDVLSPEQRAAFNSLRGSLPESATPRLRHFEN